MRFRVYLAFLFAWLAFGQTASVTGRITDGTGAVIPSAKITVASPATGQEVSVETNDQGLYDITTLQPGIYNVTVTKSGFQTLRQTGLELAVRQIARLDLTLQVGQVTESVEVRAQSIVLESESSTLGQVVQSKQITELPLLGRNTYALAMLVPGVRPSGGVNNLVVDQISTVSYAVNGQRPSLLRNPRTGRSCLGVSEMHAARLVGMDWEESRAVLRAVYEHLYAPENTTEHVWRRGDLVIWDNLTFQHARGSLESVGRRVLQRVTVGAKSLWDMYPGLFPGTDALYAPPSA